MTSAHIPGQVFGTAGGSLNGAGNTFAKNAAVATIGQAAEERTAKILNPLAINGPTVLHDLKIPGTAANIDHVVVSGYHVYILDTKHWASGTYWTFRGHTRRGLSLAAHCDKRTLPFAQQRLEQHFSQLGVHAQVHTPALVIWSNSPANLMLYRPAGGATVVPGHRLARWLKRQIKPVNAHPSVISALLQLSQ